MARLMSGYRFLIVNTAVAGLAGPACAACDQSGAINVAQCDATGVVGWITPSVSLSASRTTFDDFTMQGLDVDFTDSDWLSAEAGLEVARSFDTGIGTLRPFVSLEGGNRFVSSGDVAISDTGSYSKAADGDRHAAFDRVAHSQRARRLRSRA